MVVCRLGIRHPMSFIYSYDPIRGAPGTSMEALRRSASALTRNCDEYYIGIASGGIDGMSSRWYGKYRQMGYTDMVPLYTTTSERFRRRGV